jgi:oxalate decarboxylase
MSKVNRRAALAAAAAAAGGLVAQVALPPARAQGKAAKPSIKINLEGVPPRQYKGGSVKESNARNFPWSSTMSGNVMRLEPGGIREPHWHPNADEWDFFQTGKARITIVGPGGHVMTDELGPGDITFFPRGYGHYIENIGTDECRFLLVFNDPEPQQISLSYFLANLPKDVVAASLNLDPKALANLPKQEVYIARKPGS